MCCRVQVIGLPLDWPWVLGIAGFMVDPDNPAGFIRHVGDGGIRVTVDRASPLGSGLTFALSPSINSHDQTQHDVNAARGAIMFEAARALAEKGNGTIKQLSLVGLCAREANGTELVLAVYPDKPLLFDHLCLGFRTTLLHGIGQGEP